MKKLLALLLALTMVLSLAACGKKPATKPYDPSSDTGTDNSTGSDQSATGDNSGEHTCQFGEWNTAEKTFGVLTLKRNVSRTCTVCGKTEQAPSYEAKWDVMAQLFANTEDSICIDRYFDVGGYTDGPFSIQGLFAAGDFLATEPYAMEASEDTPIQVSADDYYARLRECFVLSDDIIAQMKQERPGDTYDLYFTYNGANLMPYSCIHNKDNIYTVYYTYGHSGATYIPQYKAEVEYNPGQPTKFLSLTTDNVVSYEMERTKNKSVTLDAFVTGAVDKATALDGLRAESIAATAAEVTQYYELFQAMDIFGFNLTEEEVFGKGWGWLNIEAEGEILKSVTMTTDMPVFDWFEDLKPSLIAAAKRDIDKFVKLIGDDNNIYTRIGKKDAEGVKGTDTITDEAIDEILSNWAGEKSICVYTNEPVTVAGYNYILSFSILSPGGMHEQAYDISLTITLA